MDLAKIREKARHERETRQLDSVSPMADDLGEPGLPGDNAPRQQMSDDHTVFDCVQPVSIGTPLPVELLSLPSDRLSSRDPLGVILAGREAAGCDEYLSGDIDEQSEVCEREYHKCLCFRVSDEVYGINIINIKELIKPRQVTEVPRTPSFVSGIISLRGLIIPIIDMPERLGLSCKKVTGRERVIVIRHGESFTGLLVDEIIEVVQIALDCIEAAPTVLEGIDRDFVTGIARADGRMIILLNLENITDIHLY